MTKQIEAMKLALEALVKTDAEPGSKAWEREAEAITALREALAEQPAPTNCRHCGGADNVICAGQCKEQPAQQEPVAWNVIDPLGKVVATETNAVRGWARIDGYKPTVEGLLGFHEKGWRVVPSTPQPPAQQCVCGEPETSGTHRIDGPCYAEQPAQEPVAPKCGAIIEVFGKDWRLEYLCLPVGRHKLYTQQYTYTSPPASKPLTDEQIDELSRTMVKGNKSVNWLGRAIEAAVLAKNGINTKGNT